LNPIALERLGCFDENFYPAYCEDQDYARRAALAGLEEGNCGDTEVFHAGSTAILTDYALRKQNEVSQSLNQAYYRRKWGGDPGTERYSSPFGRPEFDCRIAPETRRSPYGARFDRHDLELPWVRGTRS
jgi:GT2 family glycosyltransferase